MIQMIVNILHVEMFEDVRLLDKAGQLLAVIVESPHYQVAAE